MKNYLFVLKYADDTVGKVTVPEDELDEAIEKIENRGTRIVLFEEEEK